MRKMMIMMITIFMVMSLGACGSSAGSDERETDEVVKASEEMETNESEDAEAETTEAENTDVEESEITETETAGNETSGSEGFVFESNGDGTCTLTKVGVCKDADMVIPAKSPEGDMVTKIAEYAFRSAEPMSSLTFSGITQELEAKAFQSCEIEKIIISDCNLTIGENAFSYCEEVEELIINNSTIEIDVYSFYDGGKDMSVNISDCTGSLGNKAFQSSCIGSLTIKDCTLEVGENAFSYVDELEEITIENCTLELGSYAFYDAGDDTIVNIKNCKVEMDDNAFQSSCLQTINISESETVMGDNAFSYCDELTDVIIGVGNTEIGEYAFYDCMGLINVSIAAESQDDSMEIVLKDRAFQSCSVQNVIIGRGTVEIGDNAFSYCKELTNVAIGGNALQISDDAFYSCPDELCITYNGVEYNKESIETIK